MSTSGTTVWKLNRDQIITAALRKLGVVSGGSTPETYQITNGAEALNALVKRLEADGMPLWSIKTYSFNTVAGDSDYPIGPGQLYDSAKPLKVLQAWRNESTSTSNIPLNIYTNYNYDLLPAANSSGTPVNLYYQPLRDYGMVNLWPTPNTNSVSINIRYQAPFEDFTASTDDLDFPSEWTDAVIYMLAVSLAPEYGVPLQDRQLLKKEADELHATAILFGTEEGSFFFQPDTAGQK
jgi:hypothetical protein